MEKETLDSSLEDTISFNIIIKYIDNSIYGEDNLFVFFLLCKNFQNKRIIIIIYEYYFVMENITGVIKFEVNLLQHT